MANERKRLGGGAGLRKQTAGAVAKQAKKHALKNAPKKAAKKHAKKHAAKHAGKPKGGASLKGSKRELAAELTAAFHHMQRAAALVSLIEQESGSDLKVMLHRGVGLYREASEGRTEVVLAALGLLRATEHLAMAGLYSAREKQLLYVDVPETAALEASMQRSAERLETMTAAEGYAERVLSIAMELLRRAEAADHDVHLAFELAMAAEGLCLALESGLDS